MADVEGVHSEIYDLGYRHYDGPRLGRRFALRSLFVLSLRNTFGIGRGALPKVLAFTLALFAFFPALVQIVAGALADGEFELLEPQDYYGMIQVIIVLFVGAMASDLVGDDRRNNTMVLYFSRPIRRHDYILAKIASLAVALLALTLLPQLLAFAGNWLGAEDSTDWFTSNTSDLLAIVVSAVLVSAQLGAIGLLIATFASRRAFALVSVLTIFLFSFVATGILVGLLDRGWAAVVMLSSPLYVMRGATLVLFDAVPAFAPGSGGGDADSNIAYAQLPGWAWVVAIVIQTALASWFATRRYRTVT